MALAAAPGHIAAAARGAAKEDNDAAGAQLKRLEAEHQSLNDALGEAQLLTVHQSVPS